MGLFDKIKRTLSSSENGSDRDRNSSRSLGGDSRRGSYDASGASSARLGDARRGSADGYGGIPRTPSRSSSRDGMIRRAPSTPEAPSPKGKALPPGAKVVVRPDGTKVRVFNRHTSLASLV